MGRKNKKKCYSFYELIGNDDKKSIQAINEII